MKDWYSSIYKAFLFASMISFIIGFFTQKEASLGAYIAGYSTLILSILMILIILFTNVIRVTANETFFKVVYEIFVTSGPFILILGIISLVLYLLINYKNSIVNGRVAPGYYSFSNIIIVMLMVQLYIVYTNITEEKFMLTGKLPKMTSGILYLLGTITAISSIILFTILKYYSTDGFQNNIIRL